MADAKSRRTASQRPTRRRPEPETESPYDGERPESSDDVSATYLLDQLEKEIELQRESSDELARVLEPALKPDGPGFDVEGPEVGINTSLFCEKLIGLIGGVRRNTAHLEMLRYRAQL